MAMMVVVLCVTFNIEVFDNTHPTLLHGQLTARFDFDRFDFERFLSGAPILDSG
jgi:hypothetical protein